MILPLVGACVVSALLVVLIKPDSPIVAAESARFQPGFRRIPPLAVTRRGWPYVLWLKRILIEAGRPWQVPWDGCQDPANRSRTGFARRMNHRLLIDVTDADRDTFHRDGVILIKGAIDPGWIQYLQRAWERIRQLPPEDTYNLPEDFLDQDAALAEEIGAIKSEHAASRKLYTEQAEGFVRCKYMRWWATEFREFALESPAAELIGRVIGSSQVRFFLDAIFMKEPGCETRTYWHADQSAWPVRGEQVPTMWMPLYPVSAKLSSLEYVAGSHCNQDRSWPNTFNAKTIGRPPERSEFFDYETRRSDPSVRFLAFDMQPGDVVILHPAMYHGGGANLHPTQPRVALSTRWFGEDVRWDPRPECINIPGMPMAAMRPGQAVTQDDIFPVVWSDGANPVGAS